jgi:hypothetical protein
MFLRDLSHEVSLGWFLRIQGNLIEVRHRIELESWPVHGKRSGICTFSKQARMRMLKLIATIDWERIGNSVFITLTYPDECYCPDARTRAIHRQRFFRDLEGYVGREIACIWKTEWQERKSGEFKGHYRPHYHLMVLDVSFVPHAIVRDLWRAILGAKKHLATDVRQITGKLGAGKYLAKYIAKAPSLDNVTKRNKQEMNGRMWGYTRKHLIPFSPIEVERELSDEEVDLVMAAAEEQKPEYDRTLQNGFTLLGRERLERFRRKFGNGA